MAIIPEYMVKAVPKDFVTYETRCKMVQDYVIDEETKKPLRDEHGQRVKKGPARMVREDDVESRGGLMYTFPNGNSVRMASQNQLDLFGLSNTPKLIDDKTGEEVDERGVPVALAELISDIGAAKLEAGSVNVFQDDE